MKAIGPYSLWRKAARGKTVPCYFSGFLGMDPETKTLVKGGLRAEIKASFNNMDKVLSDAKVEKDDIIKTTVYLTKMSDFSDMNDEFAAYFNSAKKPTRCCVAVKELPLGALFEIEIVAHFAE